MKIRRMTPADYGKVRDLWLHTSNMGLNETDDSEEGIRKLLNRNPRTCFTAWQGERLIGVILSGNDGRRGFIYHTAVLESERGKGVGNLLVGRAMSALAAEGITKTALLVFTDNLSGNAFWEKLGFAKRGDLIYRSKAIREQKRIIT